MRRILAAGGLVVTFALAALAGEPAQHPAVTLVDGADIAFLGRVQGVAIEEVSYSAQEAAAANADPCLRRLAEQDGQAPIQVQAGRAYQLLVCKLVVDEIAKGAVLRGSVLRVAVAIAERKERLERLDSGWVEPAAEGCSRWEAPVAGGRLFALRADPDGLSFKPLLLDFPAQSRQVAADQRKAALGAICKAYRGRPGFALPETIPDEDILARLHATRIERLEAGGYRLTYDFLKPEELQDWYVINPLGDWAIEDGWLVQKSNESNNEGYMALVLATCAGFTGDMSVTVRLIPVDNDCFSIHLAHYCRQQTYTFLMNSDYGKNWEARRVIGHRLINNEDRLWSYQGDYDPRSLYTIKMGRKGKTIYVKLDGNLLFAVEDEVLQEGSIALGCKGQEGIRYDSVVIEGRFDGHWSQAEPATPTAKHPQAKGAPAAQAQPAPPGPPNVPAVPAPVGPRTPPKLPPQPPQAQGKTPEEF